MAGVSTCGRNSDKPRLIQGGRFTNLPLFMPDRHVDVLPGSPSELPLLIYLYIIMSLMNNYENTFRKIRTHHNQIYINVFKLLFFTSLNSNTINEKTCVFTSAKIYEFIKSKS